jgi:DNA gyrase subunit A
MLRFAFSDLQAQAILEMRLQRLTGLERDKILDDYRNTLANIEHYQQVLASPSLVNEIIHKEQQDLIDQYGDERRTQLIGDTTEMTIEDLITEEEVVVTLSYIKRKPAAFYRSQRRGGRVAPAWEPGKRMWSLRFFPLQLMIICCYLPIRDGCTG